ncbi:MAG: ABC transporter ATP-binding protein [Proteobacteria bacterium]|nr:ABC transporter ATP-binding protein [Pseudomonadota bacterium]MBU4277032.1 ABC transporter ATP-binding protein [Pseudomonadota bacterium]MBU4383351.1 ABC transporter ATP-binding protein [Pseudomonadota bacterium]MBU4603994.1 ABC transporter ATP-binding protein [Pseudomonadota bacterium]MCG2764390.1 ABC transporter ATP-binding protein [Desulfarculaceae bacterium]
MLNIENLKVAYGKAVALHDVSMRVEEGELVTLLGSNGAGKSTLLKTISGINRALDGRIVWNGKEIQNQPSHLIVNQGIIQVPEGRAVFPDLTVAENLRMGAFTRRDEDGVARDLKEVFDLFPRLKERRAQLAGTMSGGEAQMLAIARGLLSNPKLLMLDEPSLGLAPVVREAIYRVIQQIYQEKGITILLVEQNARWALKVATRAYILENGRVTMEDTGAALAANPDVQRAYLGH